MQNHLLPFFVGIFKEHYHIARILTGSEVHIFSIIFDIFQLFSSYC